MALPKLKRFESIFDGIARAQEAQDPPRPQDVDDQWPKKDRDYHIIRVGAVKPVPSGWLYSYTTRTNFTRARIVHYLSQYMAGALHPQAGITNGIFIQWYLYPGPKPAKRWGEVCP